MLWYGMFFATFMAVFDFMDDEKFSIVKFMLHTILFGGGMCFFLTYTHKSQLKAMGIKEVSEVTLNPIQEKTIPSKIPLQMLIGKLERLSFIKKMELDTVKNLITIVTKITSYGWGENVSIELLNNENGDYTYKVISKPKYSVVIFDSGKNLKNVLAIEKLLTKSTS